jgi:hypothetical protein
MFPTLFVGIVLVFAAMRFATRPASGRLAPIVGLGVLTMLTSCLGFVTGVIRTLLAANEIDPNAPGHVVIVGIGESLHNIALGLCLLVVAAIGTVVGLSRRRCGANEVHAVDPHAT